MCPRSESNRQTKSPHPKCGRFSNLRTRAYLREEWELNPSKQFCRLSPNLPDLFPILWSRQGLNLWPPDYESGATDQLSYRTIYPDCHNSIVTPTYTRNNISSERSGTGDKDTVRLRSLYMGPIKSCTVAEPRSRTWYLNLMRVEWFPFHPPAMFKLLIFTLFT